MDQFSSDPLNTISSDDFARERNGSRDSLLLTAQLHTSDGVDVRVRNLSSGGLMAEYPQPIAQGTPAQVEVGGVGGIIPGRIAWTAEGPDRHRIRTQDRSKWRRANNQSRRNRRRSQSPFAGPSDPEKSVSPWLQAARVTPAALQLNAISSFTLSF